MAVQPYLAVYRLVLNQQYQQTIQTANTIHLATRLGPADLVGIGNDFAASVLPTWRSRVHSGVFFRNLVIEEFVPDPTNRAVHNIGLNGTASFPVGQSAIAQPAPLAMVLTWRTAFPGRRGRGRTYVLGHWVLNNDGMHWHQTNLDAGQAIAAAIRDHYQALANPFALEHIVFSRSIGGRIPPYSIAGALPVVAHTIQTYYATMGSRRLGHGL